MSVTTQVSVVVPVYGCADTLTLLVGELVSEIEATGRSFEIVLVDDRSPDCTWTLIRDLARTDERIVGIRLSRNFRQHAAILAGLNRTVGDKVVVIDCDLQDPPNLIPLLLEAADFTDVVYAVREQQQRKRSGRYLVSLYYSLFSILSGLRTPHRIGTYCVLDRKVVNSYLELSETDRHHVAILSWLGFSTSEVPYTREARASGKSSYRFSQRVRVAFDGIMFQSTRLLTMVVVSGFGVALVGVISTARVIYLSTVGSPPPGWASTISITLLGVGAIICVQGIIGLYVGRIFSEVKNRPLFIIDETTDN